MIRVVPEIAHAASDCLGQYTCETRIIEVIDPAYFHRRIREDSLLARLDPEALFAGVVIHEWAHAMLNEVTGDRILDFGDQEYVAYAMELLALPSSERSLWLDAFPSAEAPSKSAVNGIIAAMSPLNFAARAWRYFEANGRCETIRKIVRGEATFRIKSLTILPPRIQTPSTITRSRSEAPLAIATASW